MVEIFGIVAGAAGIAGAFNDCVECFGCIQLARHFGHEFERCQLKLDVARNRLLRWGQAVDISSLSFQESAVRDGAPIPLIEGILGDILQTFTLARNTSKRRQHYDCTPTLWPSCGDRRKGVGVMKKTMWALYDAKRLHDLVATMYDLVGQLEQMYPVKKEDTHALARAEVEEIGDELSLLALQDVVRDDDTVLQAAIIDRVQEIAGHNDVGDVRSDFSAKVFVGNEWDEAALAQEIRFADNTRNTVKTIKAKGNSGVYIGNRFGGNRFSTR